MGERAVPSLLTFSASKKLNIEHRFKELNGLRGVGIFENQFFSQKAKVLPGIHLNTGTNTICNIKLGTKVHNIRA